MNKLLISLLIIFFTQTVLATQQIPIEIIEIKDGDTVLAKLENGNKFVIRLYGIDCYESKKIHRAYKQAYLDNISIDDIVEKGLLTKQYLKNEHAKSSTTTFSSLTGLIFLILFPCTGLIFLTSVVFLTGLTSS